MVNLLKNNVNIQEICHWKQFVAITQLGNFAANYSSLQCSCFRHTVWRKPLVLQNLKTLMALLLLAVDLWWTQGRLLIYTLATQIESFWSLLTHPSDKDCQLINLLSHLYVVSRWKYLAIRDVTSALFVCLVPTTAGTGKATAVYRKMYLLCSTVVYRKWNHWYCNIRLQASSSQNR